MFMMIDQVLMAKLCDGVGNLYIYEVVPSCPQTYEAVKAQGKLISKREKGDIFRLPDGTQDTKPKRYHLLQVISPTSDVEPKPQPAKAKIISKPLKAAPVAVEEKTTKAKHKGKPYVVYHSAGYGMGPANYIKLTSVCQKCGRVILLKRAVTLGGKNNKEITRWQFSVAADGLAERQPNTSKWTCGVCLKKVEAPAVEETPAPAETVEEASAASEETPAATEAVEETPAPAPAPAPAAEEAAPDQKAEQKQVEPTHKGKAVRKVAQGDESGDLGVAPPAENRFLSLVADIEAIAVDARYSADFVRGATWALIQLVNGGE